MTRGFAASPESEAARLCPRSHDDARPRTGTYIAFLADDDYWLPGYLANARRRFDADPSLGMVCGAYWLDRGAARLFPLTSAPEHGRYERWLSLVMRFHTFIPSTTVLRREVWEQVRGPWPDCVIGDLVLWIDTAINNWPLYWSDEPLAVYCYHTSQISHNEEAFRDANVTVFGSYEFPDPHDELMRRDRLAHAYIARAGLRLRQRRSAEARSDLREARRLEPVRQRPRRLAYTALSATPWLLPAITKCWRAVRGVGVAVPDHPTSVTR